MSRLRKGMWVLHEGQVGVVTELAGDVCEIHYVDGAGLTVGIVRAVSVDAVAQAALANIPEPRRPSADVARHYGYA